ncbi:uncharacterized protein DUF2851 [Tenacibaculum skagerrakense]|uniref:Uncharacterized protein DUF2851 n=1 Tax=Tenacibaculum skagerrakense TaxID=186571 RepID=A0A4R2NMT2_9FLAO|nr:DUF2851 family protein [Tenacibaculum skagerrakense]TCP22989.1 uncharacterized protein DUF2851 [Tenacibaculum skagerrakense]
MKEKFLHYLWKNKLLLHDKLFTTQNEKVTIVNCGQSNDNSGPDFLNASLQIDQQLWYGNVEIHQKTSDWYAHEHETDTNYDAVILHVVYEDDVEVYMKNNKIIPTLELKGKIDEKLFQNYSSLISKKINWIACGNQISTIDSFIVNNWLERLFFERLEKKSESILILLKNVNNDYEAVLFQMLAKNFGLKVNGEAFLNLSTSFDFSVLRKVWFDEFQLAALLFGQAGFLEEESEVSYFNELRNEYHYLKHKYSLNPIDKKYFQFFRIRPNNFPTIRIAQLIALYVKCHNLFSRLMEIKKPEEVYELLDVEVNIFWKTHYTFEKESKKSSKKLSKSFIDLLIINTIIPLKFVYCKSKNNLNENEILEMLESLHPEKNSIISNFEKLKVKIENSFKTQALLELYKGYCSKKRCLDCAIGNQLLKSS